MLKERPTKAFVRTDATHFNVTTYSSLRNNKVSIAKPQEHKVQDGYVSHRNKKATKTLNKNIICKIK